MNTKQFLVGLVMIMMAGAAMGQNDCYNPTMRAAKAAYDKGNYQRAEQLYREASECYDCTAQQKAQAKRKAEESRKKRVAATTTGSTTNSQQQREEELRRREERLRQREAALRREEEQAAERKRQEEARQAEERRKREEAERNRITWNVSGVEFTMVRVEGGTFTMGCTSEQGGDCWGGEEPAHGVTLSSYYMGETEVTQALWQAVMGNNPSHWKGDNLPVEQVSWTEVQEFIEKLNRLTGRTFRLPTEAEWEYAARGGNKSRGYKYSGSNSIDAVAWYDGNSGEKTHSVKGKQANELGLYDMSGNVDEWCSDWGGDYSSSLQRDPGGPSTGSYRVGRGGRWGSNVRGCRVSYRHFYTPSCRINNLGFRLVFVP